MAWRKPATREDVNCPEYSQPAGQAAAEAVANRLRVVSAEKELEANRQQREWNAVLQKLFLKKNVKLSPLPGGPTSHRKMMLPRSSVDGT